MISSGEIIRNLRSELSLNQDDFAAKINRSTRWLSRVESNAADVHIIELVDIMAKFGKSMHDVSVFVLPNKERHLFEMYTNCIKCIRMYEWDEAVTIAAHLRENAVKPIHTSFVDFHVAYSETHQKMHLRNPQFEEYNAEDFADMHRAMSAILGDFNEEDVEDYLLTFYEAYLLCNMSYALFVMGEPERSIELAKKVVNNKSIQARKNYNGVELLYLRVVHSLLDSYVDNGMYKDALAEAVKLQQDMIDANSLRNIPNCLNLISAAYAGLGEYEDIFKAYVIRAYHWAVLRGVQMNIDFFRNKCEQYGFDINYMPG